MFNKNKLSVAIVSLLAAGSSQVFAQDAPVVEEVVVTGIRAAAEAAMDIKRDSVGVVDAISAEEMGKFPDTNLAESLQRITGVSISRSNGEGSEVTVRGFGPGNNMITLNGRTMPSGTSYAGGSGADSTSRAGGNRAFNFANLASENIAGVEVYKTSKANIATGGIGATINIKTARPLDNPGLNVSVGAKAVADTTNRYNDDVTPELSGIVSWTDDSEMFGVALSLSYQERDSASSGVTVNNWNIGVWGEDDIYSQNAVPVEDRAEVINAPEEGQLYARPNDFRYGFSDIQRDRLNGQLTFQFRPSDRLTATLDYTYADNNIEEHRGEVTNWIQNGSNVAQIVFDDSAIATPLTITEAYRNTDGTNRSVDIGFEQQYRAQSNTLKSLGLNLEFQVNDQFKLALDVHDSTMESLPDGPGNSGEVAIGLGAPVVTDKTLDFSREFPTYSHTTTVAGNALTEQNVGTSILRIRGSGSVNDITQIKLDGSFEFDDGRFDFGVESRAMEMNAYQTSEFNQALGNWNVGDPGVFAGQGLLETINVHGEFDDFDVSRSPGIAFRGDAVALTQNIIARNLYPGSVLNVANTYGFKDLLEEDTLAFYIQGALSGEMASFPVNVLAGVRYETTDVRSQNLVNPIPYLIWQTDNDFAAGPGGAAIPFEEESDYDNLLPSLDIDVKFTDEITGRASFSKTIARAGYADLRAAPGSFGATGTTVNGFDRTATRGNPGLLPLESDNFDLSLEYYFADTSYASIGFFEKRVSNFIGTGQQAESFFGILDQTHPESPRIIEAIADLEALGFATDDANLFSMMVLNQYPDVLDDIDTNDVDKDGNSTEAVFPNGVYEGSGLQTDYLGSLTVPGTNTPRDITTEAGDPLSVFLTSRPVNDEDAKIYGTELAFQYFLGETGVGFQANYTLVRGDVGFNDLGLPTEDQFALTGLSDTANLVLMYENYGVQARLAFNWRDEFLAEVNQGSSRNPRYVEAYHQIDFSVSYDITEQLSISAEGLNITEEDNREFNRNERMLRFADDLGARYQLGIRYTL